MKLNKLKYALLATVLVSVLSTELSAQYSKPRREVLEDVILRDTIERNTYYREGTAHIEFPLSKSEILNNYKNNYTELKNIEEDILTIKSTPGATVTKVVIVGYGSPEGPYSINERLSKERAQALSNYLKTEFGNNFSSSTQFVVSSVAEDWDGLKELVEESTTLPKEKILNIISSYDIFDGREKKLMDLNGGDTYRYMLTNTFPQLRRAYWRIDYTINETNRYQIADTLLTVVDIPGDTVGYSGFYAKNTKRRSLIPDYTGVAAIKTNLLYWAALTPNIGIDFYISRHSTIGIEGAYADWNQKSGQKRNWGIGMAALEYRYWTRNNSSGHFVGAHAGWATYNFKFDETGHQGQAYGGGLLYGYALPVTKHINIEFMLAVGYVETNKIENYKPVAEGGYILASRKKVQYFGPTKVGVNFVYKF